MDIDEFLAMEGFEGKTYEEFAAFLKSDMVYLHGIFSGLEKHRNRLRRGFMPNWSFQSARFVSAQAPVFETALAERKAGKKHTY